MDSKFCSEFFYEIQDLRSIPNRFIGLRKKEVTCIKKTLKTCQKMWPSTDKPALLETNLSKVFLRQRKTRR